MVTPAATEMITLLGPTAGAISCSILGYTSGLTARTVMLLFLTVHKLSRHVFTPNTWGEWSRVIARVACIRARARERISVY